MRRLGFWHELKRRNVLRAAVLYIGAAWAISQGMSQLTPALGLPDWATRWFLIACAVGFPFWIAFAWYYAITPQGIKRESDVAPGESLSHSAARKLDFAIIGVLALAVVLLATQLLWHQPAVPANDAGAATPQPVLAKSIAVLPFENLSSSKDNAYFADGMQDLILTKLADIGDLKVIARTSTESYGSHPGDLSAIARQLGVATILEGSVQKAGNEVLINVQLIDAATDSHIWAQSYQRTLDNIFGVEGEVAQKVADALDAKLTAPETQAVARIPTTNPQAYDDYLRGLHFDHEAGKGAWTTYLPQAIAAYGKAVAADPGFALAWAALSSARSDARYWGVDRSESNMRAADAAARRALALAPKLADAHLAMAGVQRLLYHNIAAAREQNQRAVDLRPNDPDALENLAISDAHSGDVPAAIKVLDRVVVLDPTGAVPDFELGLFLTAAGDYPDARRALSSALAIDPQNLPAYLLLSRVDLLQHGNVKAAAAVLDNMPPGTPSNAALAAARIELLVYQRDFAAARTLAGQHACEFTAGPAAITVTMARANVEWLAGRKDAARGYYRTAVHLLSEPDTNAGAFDHLELALAHARLGEGATAKMENEVAAAIDRRSHDMAGVETERSATLARTQLALGNPAGAIDILGKLLARKAHGYLLSPALLRIDPTWDPIRKDARFQALLQRYPAMPASASIAASPPA
ncbi:MAG: tetratricopeptide repeat protein [Rhodanobacteraceae bacterium]